MTSCPLRRLSLCAQGKTHTLVGSKSDPGITTRSVNDLFACLQAGASEGTDFLVRVSYIELYNEEIRDLLSSDPNPDHKLSVGDHPEMGS